MAEPGRPSESGGSPGPDRVQRILAGQNHILELIARGDPLTSVLDRLTRIVEELARPAICSILLIENGRVRHAAAPGLPAGYAEAINGEPIGPRAGSCGTAAFHRRRVVVRDIATDPLWVDYREVAFEHGLRVCWSQPIMTDDGAVLGMFALYYQDEREPGEEDWHLLDVMAKLVIVVVERDKREKALYAIQQNLRENEQRLRERVLELEQARERMRIKRRRLEQLAADLTQARNEAASANRMKSEFLANMSHELRTPLNAIIGFSEIIMSEMLGSLGNATYREYARDIHDSGQHLLAVIGEVLDLSRIEAGRFELSESIIDLGDTAVGCIRLMRERARSAGVELECSLADDVPPVSADEIKIKQVLLNLLSNAVKFTPRGGRIRLTVERAADGGVFIRIADTGIGMRPEDIPVALEPFRQIDSMITRKYEGTGLGLPLAKAIVEHHGGQLSIDTAVGQGTTVTVHLPPERSVDPEHGAR